MIFKSKKTTSNINFELKSGNHIFNEVKEIKFLGITIPTDLKFKTHYEKVIKKMKSGIAAINHVKKLLPTQTKLQIFNALVKSHYEYCARLGVIRAWPKGPEPKRPGQRGLGQRGLYPKGPEPKGPEKMAKGAWAIGAWAKGA